MGQLPSKFIVLTSQRTGSTWLVDMLDSHPQIVSYSELFLGGGQGVPTWGGSKDVLFWETYRQRAREVGESCLEAELLRRYLATVFAVGVGIRAVGFKVMYEQLGNAGLRDCIRSDGLRVVHLVRNGLDVLVSRVSAAHSGVYHARLGEPSPPTRVVLEPGVLSSQLREHDRAVAAARSSWSRGPDLYFEMSYEKLRSDGAALSSLLDFLGVESRVKLSSHLRRLHASPRRERIENWDEVVQALANTPYSGLLADGPE